MRIEPDFLMNKVQTNKSEGKKDAQKPDIFDKMLKNDKNEARSEKTKEEKVEPTKEQRTLIEKAMKENSKNLPAELQGKTELPKDFKMDKAGLEMLMKALSKEFQVQLGSAEPVDQLAETPETSNIETPETNNIETPSVEEPNAAEEVTEGGENVEGDQKPIEGEVQTDVPDGPDAEEVQKNTVDSSLSKKTEGAEKVEQVMDGAADELIKKEEKLANLVNKIKGDPNISNAIKEKLINMIENKMEPEGIIQELKTEIAKTEWNGFTSDMRETGSGTRLDSKMEIKDWVDRIKTELKYMVDFRVESENKIRLNLNNGDGYIRLNIERINNEIIIQSDTSNSMRKRVDEILAEVRVEMRDRNVEVRLEREKGKEQPDEEQEEHSEREERGGQNGDRSDQGNEQRRRSE